MCCRDSGKRQKPSPHRRIVAEMHRARNPEDSVRLLADVFSEEKSRGTPRECLFLIPKNRGTFFRGLLRVRGGVVRESTPWEVVVHYRCQGRLRRPEEETRIRSRLRQTQRSPHLFGLKGKPWTTGSGQPRLWSRVAASGHV